MIIIFVSLFDDILDFGYQLFLMEVYYTVIVSNAVN